MGTLTSTLTPAAPRKLLDMDKFQWMTLFVAWLGWGFDIFDGLLFIYVAPNCVPTLLHIPIGSPEAKAATLAWVGGLTSLLLIGWAVGGIFFGWLADSIGDMPTLLLTMALYSLGTALCAFAPNIWILALCRFIASLGIGGEWAAGAAMVSETVPPRRRVEAGALLYTASPLGLFLATFVNYQIAGVYFKSHPELSWRYVFLFGLLPACIAFTLRFGMYLRERREKANAAGVGTSAAAITQNRPEDRAKPKAETARPQLRDLFEKQYCPPATSESIPSSSDGNTDDFKPKDVNLLARTISGFLTSLTALITWWSTNAFIPIVAKGLAQESAKLQGLGKAAAAALGEQWTVTATCNFNLGGLIGTLLTVFFAKTWGRRPMFAIYFAASAVSLLAAFGLNLPPSQRLLMYFPVGLSVFGVFGSFTFYLPELFPRNVRAMGAGFCYNVGRVLAALGPFLVGRIASQGTNALSSAFTALFWVGFVPLAGLLALPWILETRDWPFDK